MPFKLGQINQNTGAKQPSPAKIAPAANTGKAVPAPSAIPTAKKQAQKSHAQRQVSINLPCRIACFVIYSTDSGAVTMKNCGSEAKAKDFIEKLESGYIGN